MHHLDFGEQHLLDATRFTMLISNRDGPGYRIAVYHAEITRISLSSSMITSSLARSLIRFCRSRDERSILAVPSQADRERHRDVASRIRAPSRRTNALSLANATLQRVLSTTEWTIEGVSRRRRRFSLDLGTRWKVAPTKKSSGAAFRAGGARRQGVRERQRRKEGDGRGNEGGRGDCADAVGEDRCSSDVTGRACRRNVGDRTMSRYDARGLPFEEKHSYSRPGTYRYLCLIFSLLIISRTLFLDLNFRN